LIHKFKFTGRNLKSSHADRLDVLFDLAKPFRHVTTAAVAQEPGQHGLDHTISTADIDASLPRHAS
jgi:hypothetical protein